MHYHVRKDETFLVTHGCIQLELIYKDGVKKSFLLLPGQSFHIPPGLMHRFTGVEAENRIVEFSTEHFEEDSFRAEKGD